MPRDSAVKRLTRLRARQMKADLGDMARKLSDFADDLDPDRQRSSEFVVKLDQAASAVRRAENDLYLQLRRDDFEE